MLSQRKTVLIREVAKKVLLLMAGPLRPNPPPLEPLGRWNVGTLEKKVKKKVVKKKFTLPE